MSFKVSWKLHILCLVISLGTCFIFKDHILNAIVKVLLSEVFIDLNINFFISYILLVGTCLILTTLVHELLHGAMYILFGGKIKFGFKLVCAYTMETSGIVLHRTKFLIVLLAPLTIISIGSLFLGSSLGLLVFIFNLFGSTGDLLMALYLCKTNERSYIIDTEYGFDVIGSL